MTFFVDANVCVYSATPTSEYHESCLELLRAIAAGESNGRTSSTVLEEVWHIELSGRAGAFRHALDLNAPGIGANDRLHVGTCREHSLDVVVTADRDFDDVPGIRRVDPLDEPAVLSLLSG